MLNVHELERSWLRYKVRHLLPLVAAVIAFLSLSAIGYWFFFETAPKKVITPKGANAVQAKSDSSPKGPQQPPLNTAPKITAIVSPTAPASTPPRLKTQKQETRQTPSPKVVQTNVAVIKPSMGFLDVFENAEKNAPYRPAIDRPTPQSSHVVTSRPTQKHIPVKKAQETIKVITPPQTAQVVSTHKPSNISIVAREDEDDLQDVIKRFKKNKNPALSLFIAKRYYELGRYQKAYNYALITNDINSGIEDSWLIFAKSLVKLDQKEMAIKALDSYIDESDSARAKILLDDISQGELR